MLFLVDGAGSFLQVARAGCRGRGRIPSPERPGLVAVAVAGAPLAALVGGAYVLGHLRLQQLLYYPLDDLALRRCTSSRLSVG